MEFLYIVASATKRRPILSTQVTDATGIAPLGYTDNIKGKITVVRETSDPTGPTQPLAIDTSSGIALTDGLLIVYANSIILGVTNGNEVNFTMVVDSIALAAELAQIDGDFLEAILEVRVTSEGQDVLLLREPVLIQKAASSSGALALTPAAIPGVIYNYTLNVVPDIDAIPTAGLSTMTLLLATLVVDGYKQLTSWQLIAGAANPLDPGGQRAPNDYNAITNLRHWEKVG